TVSSGAGGAVGVGVWAQAHGTHSRREPNGQPSKPVNFSEMMRALVTVGPSSTHRPQRPSTGGGASTAGRPAATHAAAAGSESMLASRYGPMTRRIATVVGT